MTTPIEPRAEVDESDVDLLVDTGLLLRRRARAGRRPLPLQPQRGVMTSPVDWPRRWGTSWIAAAVLFAAASLGVWLAGYHGLAAAGLVLAMAFYSRAAYWRGYRHGRRSTS